MPYLRFICRVSDLRAFYEFICQISNISATIQITTNSAAFQVIIITKKYKHIDTINLKIFVIFERIRSEMKSLI